MIHDQDDPAVPFASGEKTFSEATSQKDFWKTDNAHHIAIFSDPKSPYREKFVQLLANLQSAAADLGK